METIISIETEAPQILEKFYAYVKRTNPSFTEYSLHRTIEVTINDVLNLGYMNLVGEENIIAIVELIDRDKISVREA